MLAVIENTFSGHAGAVLSALIVILCVIGLTMHKDFYTGKSRCDFFCFYTNQSNLLVLVYFALVAPRLYAHSTLYMLIPGTEFAVMMIIMLTFCVFHVLLFPAVRSRILQMPHTREFYIVCIDNLIIHYLVPLLVFTYWVFCAPGKPNLTPAHALYWTAFPLAYVVFILLRAQTGRIIEETASPYPYPFLNIQVLGIRAVAYTSLRLYSLCILSGLMLIAAVRLFAFVSG